MDLSSSIYKRYYLARAEEDLLLSHTLWEYAPREYGDRHLIFPLQEDQYGGITLLPGELDVSPSVILAFKTKVREIGYLRITGFKPNSPFETHTAILEGCPRDAIVNMVHDYVDFFQEKIFAHGKALASPYLFVPVGDDGKYRTAITVIYKNSQEIFLKRSEGLFT